MHLKCVIILCLKYKLLKIKTLSADQNKSQCIHIVWFDKTFVTICSTAAAPPQKPGITTNASYALEPVTTPVTQHTCVFILACRADQMSSMFRTGCLFRLKEIPA